LHLHNICIEWSEWLVLQPILWLYPHNNHHITRKTHNSHHTIPHFSHFLWVNMGKISYCSGIFLQNCSRLDKQTHLFRVRKASAGIWQCLCAARGDGKPW
jgi:hypothetical protein